MKTMAGKADAAQHAESFEYVLLESDPDHLRTVFSTPSNISHWISPSALKLKHRIGRGPFGDVWIATHHHYTGDNRRYREVAVKMLHPIKDDQLQVFLDRFDELFRKCRGIEKVCFLHGVTFQNGKVGIAMKFYEGSVGDKMARLKGGRLSLFDVLRYGTDLARGVLELHSRGILVLNLKPCNFLLDEHDRSVLGDVGIPFLLFGLSLTCPDLIQRLGTPNYMAPEQWEPSIRGPIGYETDSWGFGCSIVEMLSGVQPWRGKSADEIYELVVIKKEKPHIPNGLPTEIENVIFGCFEYDFRDRPLMVDIFHAFKICSWDDDLEKPRPDKLIRPYTDWFLLKDNLQVSDTVRSRKPRKSCRLDSMAIPEGTIVGIEDDDGGRDGFVLVRVHGFHDPLKVHSSTLERVTRGFAAGDWVSVRPDNKKPSRVGILHSIGRDGAVAVGLIGTDTLWKGTYSELQMAESYCIGQFIKPKDAISSPRFDWPCKAGGAWATGKIEHIHPNGCLSVKFPGRFSFGEDCIYLADPSEAEVVSFDKCKGVVKKYQHLEDFHWAVRPLVIAFGLFTALKVGLVVGKSVRRSSRAKVASVSDHGDE